MKFTILGSGGYLRTPKPCCQCRLCEKARTVSLERRLGPCMYFDDAKMLIDTPEDVAEALSHSGIDEVKHLFISHWHPDHAAGVRVVEQICASLNFRSSSGEKNQTQPERTVNLWIPKDSFEKLTEVSPVISYMQKCSFITVNFVEDEFEVEGIQFKAVRINNIPVYALVIRDKDKKAVVCMDHAKDLLTLDDFSDLADSNVLFMNLGYADEDLPENHLRRLDTSLEDNISIKDRFNPKKTVLIHIEELWGRTHDDYLSEASPYSSFTIPRDGDQIEV